MLIQGQILSIMPPNFSDQWGNQYQDVVVRTASGDIKGQKASKNVLTANDVGREIAWDCEAKQNARNQPYNKFTKPQDPQYASQDAPQRPQNTPQGTNVPISALNSKDASICRQTAGKVAAELLASCGADSIMQSPNETAALLVSVAKPIAEWFLTGREPMIAPVKPQYQANPNYVGDDPPPPTDNDVPF